MFPIRAAMNGAAQAAIFPAPLEASWGRGYGYLSHPYIHGVQPSAWHKAGWFG